LTFLEEDVKVKLNYTTDGSGIDHRKYNDLRPTVWAYLLGVCMVFF